MKKAEQEKSPFKTSDKRPNGLFYSRSEHGSTNNLMHGGLEENPNEKLRELFEMLSHDTGLDTSRLFHNSSAARLYEDALKFEEGSVIVSSGALATFSGAKTGRCPKDKRVVAEPESEKDVWWGPVNIPIDEHTFSINRERAVDYLKTRKRIYVFDGFAGWDPKYRIKVRVICARAYHALFMNNMLIRPNEEELENFGQPDFTILNAGEFPANKYTTGMTSETSVVVNFHKKEMGSSKN
jgi:phosphoenolpyruvate carboxykinase (ATP)